MSDLAAYFGALDVETVNLNGTELSCPRNSRVVIDAFERLLSDADLSEDDGERLSLRLVDLAVYHAFRRSPSGSIDEAAALIDVLARANERFSLFRTARRSMASALVNLCACMKQDRAAFDLFRERFAEGRTRPRELVFNLACVCAIHGLVDEALGYLAQASEGGYSLAEIESDPELAPVRALPRYRAILVERRFTDAEKKTPELVVETLENLSPTGYVSRTNGERIAHSSASFFHYGETPQATPAVLALARAWLDHGTRLPFLPEERNRVGRLLLEELVSRGVDSATASPLADELLTGLLVVAMNEGHDAMRVAEALAALGKVDAAYGYYDKALADGVDPATLTDERWKLVRALYEQDERFRSLAGRRAAEEKAVMDLLLAEPDPSDFEAVYTAATLEFSHRKSYGRKGRVVALARFRDGPHRDRVAEFLRTGFDALRARRLKKDDLVDQVMFDALVWTIAEFGDPSFIPVLKKEFVFITDDEAEEQDGIPRHYELNQAAGSIAIALSALGYDGETAFMEPFLESYEWRYEGEDFVMQTRYGKWMIEGDPGAPLSWLSDEARAKGASWVVCALADLGVSEAVPLLRARLESLKNPVTVEVFKEAITRLEAGTGTPPWSGRMVRLFGMMTPTERALGADGDNVFLSRAVAASGRPDLGVVIETDDSAAED